jgi:chorismate mutase
MFIPLASSQAKDETSVKQKKRGNTLHAKRAKIDSVDLQLLVLLNRRAAIVDEIKEIKNKRGILIFDPVRELEIIKNLNEANLGPLSNKEIQTLFTLLLRFFRNRQRRKL